MYADPPGGFDLDAAPLGFVTPATVPPALGAVLRRLWGSRHVGPDLADVFPELAGAHCPVSVLQRCLVFGDGSFDAVAARAAAPAPSAAFLACRKSDTASVQALGLQATFQARAAALAASQAVINRPAIEALCADSPFLPALLRVADGVDVGVAFRGSTPLPPSERCRRPAPDDRVPANVVLAHAAKLQERGLAILVDWETAAAARTREGLDHISAATFAVFKPGKPLGRWIGNYKSNGLNGTPVDSPDRRWADLAGETYLPIQPTSSAIICRHLALARLQHGHAQVAMEIDDASYAHNREPIHPDSINLGALALRGPGARDTLLFPLTAQFGHYQSGFGWEPIAAECARQDNARGRLAGLQYDVSHWLFDDSAKVGTPSYLEADRHRSRALAGTDEPGIAGRRVLGSDKFQSSTSTPARTVTHGGIVYDLARWRTHLTLRRFARTLIMLWCHTPDKRAGEWVKVRVLQALFSYAVQLGSHTRAPYLRFFGRALSRHIGEMRRQGKELCGSIPLNEDCVTAIRSLRLWSLNALERPECLLLDIDRVPLLSLARDTSIAELHARQEAAADCVIFSDACLSLRTIAAYVPERGWAVWTVPADWDPAPWTINVLELAGMVLAVALALHTLGDDVPDLHLHRRADSGVALAQAMNQSTNHSLPRFLILLEQTILARSGAMCTQAHIAGILNTIADAASRLFTTPDSIAVRATLISSTPAWRPSAAWQQLMEAASRPSTSSLSSQLAALATTATTSTLFESCG